jgi:hypothetical protein
VALDGQSKHPHQSGWGQVENIGIKPNKDYNVPFIRPPPRVLTGREFWSLPEDLVTDSMHIHLPFQAESTIKCPPVDYRRGGGKKKPKKATGGKKKKVRKRDRDTSSEPDESEESEESDERDHSDVAPLVTGEPTIWGANFDHCVPGSYAVIQTEYDGNHSGISVLRVLLFLFFLNQLYVFLALPVPSQCPPSAIIYVFFFRLTLSTRKTNRLLELK